MSKQKNLQPWLDYFRMLQTYEKNGFIEMQADKHEAYVTRAALMTLASFDEQSNDWLQMQSAFTAVVSNIRTYAAYLAAYQRGLKDFSPNTIAGADLPPVSKKELVAYLLQNFAIHMVSDDDTHKPLCTLLLSRKRNCIGRKSDCIEVISYMEKEK